MGFGVALGFGGAADGDIDGDADGWFGRTTGWTERWLNGPRYGSSTSTTR